ncbi:MAG: hypothetical protein A2143_05925 [Gallionellales bacterium RBG_16_57_15]|nr:MAG: hypothetical protein A2143_05925 [Gallionellales bacterium RBG_16_57_15]
MMPNLRMQHILLPNGNTIRPALFEKLLSINQPARSAIVAKSGVHIPGETSSAADGGSNELSPGSPVTQEQLNALLAQNADLMRQLAAAGKPKVRNASADADLPDQKSIDLATLKNPVLTKQGWLVPPEYGTHRNALR